MIWYTTIEVQTKYNENVIEQSVLYPDSDLIGNKVKEILHLKEQGVKDVLEKLGYLNPQQSVELLNALDNLCRAYRMRTGLNGAWDSELLDAQKLLEKYK